MVRGFVDDFGQHWVARDDHKQALAEKEDAYQQLMEQAIAIAQGCIRMIPYNRAEHEEAIKFLSSPEVQTFLKEREGT